MRKINRKTTKSYILRKEKKKESWSKRPRFYQSKEWRRAAATYKAENPLCEQCLKAGFTEPGTDVDHIQAIEDGGSKFDIDNLQTLCKNCHNSKSAKERYNRENEK